MISWHGQAERSEFTKGVEALAFDDFCPDDNCGLTVAETVSRSGGRRHGFSLRRRLRRQCDNRTTDF